MNSYLTQTFMATPAAGQSRGRREGRGKRQIITGALPWLQCHYCRPAFISNNLDTSFLQDCLSQKLTSFSQNGLYENYILYKDNFYLKILRQIFLFYKVGINIIQEREKYFDSFIVVISSHQANNMWGNCENILYKTNIILN